MCAGAAINPKCRYLYSAVRYIAARSTCTSAAAASSVQRVSIEQQLTRSRGEFSKGREPGFLCSGELAAAGPVRLVFLLEFSREPVNELVGLGMV